jgi:phage terminase small subunit
MQRHRGRKSAAELATITPLQTEPPRHPAAPPNHLSVATKAWWNGIVRRHDLQPHQFRVLEIAAQSWDRAEQARQTLNKHGLNFDDDRGMIRARPEVAIERDSQIRFLRAIRELNLGVEPPDHNRNTIGISWRQLENQRRLEDDR